ESPNLEFEYGDTDALTAELSELYSYTEEPEFALNRDYFEEDFRSHARSRRWSELPLEEQRAHVMRLLDALEVTDRDKRLKVARAILYLAQGVFDECDTEADVLHWSRHNVFLLYHMGIFTALLELLSMEIDNNQACSSAVSLMKGPPTPTLAHPYRLNQPGLRLPAAPKRKNSRASRRWRHGRLPLLLLCCPADACSPPCRVLLSIMYLMVETIRVRTQDDRPEWKAAREAFRSELASPSSNGEPFALLLFTMVTKFCSMNAPHFPMKKVLLLLWKTVLPGHLQRAGPLQERRCPGRGGGPRGRGQRHRGRGGPSGSGRHHPAAAAAASPQGPRRKGQLPQRAPLGPESQVSGLFPKRGERAMKDPSVPSPRPHQFQLTPPCLCREKDIEHFLETSRNKFIGFTLGRWVSQTPPAFRFCPPSPASFLPSDVETLVGLPRPIHESVKTLKQHKYVSIAEVQIRREEELQQCPLTLGEEEVEETPAEILYLGMLPNLSQFVIALLKLLLAAAPTSKAKTDSINILADVLPEEMPITVLQSMKLGIDVNRHKEIIVKAISALLLLLLKHFKLNHVYQFEIVSQHLVFANCIPLILKFFNQNIMSYISAKNSICVLDFPHCVVHEMPELTAESLQETATSSAGGTLFSCINLLRILNKLTKWKHSRTMVSSRTVVQNPDGRSRFHAFLLQMLVVFKSAPILKRALKVKQAMMQLYVLKLLKIQTKYLGRQWRKSNMKTMSAIYQKVRHRLNDDWAYGNDIDARPWDFQAEECALRENIEKFNSRRYDKNRNGEFAPVDNCLQSVLGQRVDLPEDFHYSYEMWLEREVFSQPIQWEGLLQ
ncbi:unnamed protein product, partial [Tetraodon nigroviridis]